MEPVDTLTYSQENATVFYAEPNKSSPKLPNAFPLDPLQYYISIFKSYKKPLPFRFLRKYFMYFLFLP
jgi:hypothetical protein